MQTYRTNKANDALYAAQKLAQGSAEQQKALEEISDDYTSTPAGREAMMFLGDMFVARGDFASALPQFENLAKKSKGNGLLKIAALHKVAAAQRAMGKAEDAAGTYLTAAEDFKNLNKEDSLFQAASCYEYLKQYDEAAKLYRRVIDTSPESGIKSKSEERLLWLIADGSVSS